MSRAQGLNQWATCLCLLTTVLALPEERRSYALSNSLFPSSSYAPSKVVEFHANAVHTLPFPILISFWDKATEDFKCCFRTALIRLTASATASS